MTIRRDGLETRHVWSTLAAGLRESGRPNRKWKHAHARWRVCVCRAVRRKYSVEMAVWSEFREWPIVDTGDEVIVAEPGTRTRYRVTADQIFAEIPEEWKPQREGRTT